MQVRKNIPAELQASIASIMSVSAQEYSEALMTTRMWTYKDLKAKGIVGSRMSLKRLIDSGR
jgi:hypothetical protein